MKIGIIAEGPGDVAVIVNILRGKLGIDGKDRPNLLRDKERRLLFQLRERDAFAFYDELSRPFRKPGELARCAGRNESLRLFVDSL